MAWRPMAMLTVGCQWYLSWRNTGFHFKKKKAVTNVVTFLLSSFRHIRNCLSGKAASLYFRLFYWALTIQEEEKEPQSEVSHDGFRNRHNLKKVLREMKIKDVTRSRVTRMEKNNKSKSRRWFRLERRKTHPWDLVVKQNVFATSSKHWWLLYGEGQMRGGLRGGRWAAVLNIREAAALRKRGLGQMDESPPLVALFSDCSAFTYMNCLYI